MKKSFAAAFCIATTLAIFLITSNQTPVAVSGFPAADRRAPNQQPIPSLSSSKLSVAALPNTHPGGPLPGAMQAPAELQKVFPQAADGITDWHAFNERVDQITVKPYEDLPIVFEREAVKSDGKYTTWFGKIPSIPGSSLVTVASSETYDAILILPGTSQLSYHVAADGRIISTEPDPAEEGCAVPGVQPNQSVVHLPLTVPLATAYIGKDPLMSLSAALDADAKKVDVLVLYDSDALTAANIVSTDGAAYIDGQSKAMIESGNVVLNQSGVTNFFWRYLGSVRAPDYTKTQSLSDDLMAMSSGAISSFVATQRASVGADQIFLWRGNNSPNVAGSAFVGPLTNASSAVAVGIWGSSYKVIIHELGHGFGCRHDRFHAAANGGSVPDGDGQYYYGQLWTHENGATASTIMGYGTSIIPYFSTPNITVHITSALADRVGTNDWGTLPLGFAVNGPKAAFNVKVFQDNSATISDLVDEIGPPTITVHPVSVSVQSGSSFSVSVTASGGNLTYRWSKDGADIAGANNSTYSKSTVATSDAGSYRVVVTNPQGTATSNFATITVTTAQPPPPSGGSGGGGGAVSPFFLSILSLLVFTRIFSWSPWPRLRPSSAKT